ncbi:MAG: glycosyltransferase [Planctomycetaceae bacterium]
MIWLLWLVSSFALFWIYDGYGRFLQIAVLTRRGSRPSPLLPTASASDSGLPSMTVLLTVHNEQEKVVARIENLLRCRYPNDRLAILVASDGSTDCTDELVKSFSDRGVTLFQGQGRERRRLKTPRSSRLIPI